VKSCFSAPVRRRPPRVRDWSARLTVVTPAIFAFARAWAQSPGGCRTPRHYRNVV
jgi:hypothetical protein